MITSNILQKLHCPYCGSRLDIDCLMRADGQEMCDAILTCSCQSYPILDGILVLRPVSVPLLEHLRAGNTELALRRALYELVPENSRRQRRLFIDAFLKFPWSPARRMADRAVDRLARRTLVKRDETFYQASARLMPGAYAAYLYQRYANPSFVAALLLLITLDGGGCGAPTSSPEYWLLDLACGVGHSSFVMQRLLPNARVVAADHNFVNLYFARHFLAREALPICCDAETPLPFADHFFDAVFCLDAFHYMLSKMALVRELERVVAPHGQWLLPHLHNAQVPNAAPGVPLPLEGYQRCFAAIQPRFFSEAGLLQTFFQEGAIDLSITPPEAELRRANALCLVGGQPLERWRRYADVGSFLCRDPSTLMLNPLYRLTPVAKRVHLQMQWPNARLEAECAEIKRFLPEHYELDHAFCERLAGHTTVAEDTATMQSLARRFLLVHLPPRY
jgi:SAM-dependent methyltransferase